MAITFGPNIGHLQHQLDSNIYWCKVYKTAALVASTACIVLTAYELYRCPWEVSIYTLTCTFEKVIAIKVIIHDVFVLPLNLKASEYEQKVAEGKQALRLAYPFS